MNKKYILNDQHQAVPCDDLEQWAAWFDNTANRRVSETFICGTRISTVFLGLNHQFGEGTPLLFETIAFSKDGEEEFCERCSTWDEAVAQHERAVDTIRSMKPPDTVAPGEAGTRVLETARTWRVEERSDVATPLADRARKTPE